MSTIIDVASLGQLLDSGRSTVLLDVRWALGDPHGHAHFRHGHIPGAVYVDLPTELADPAEPARGRHPLPSPSQLQSRARAWGVNDGDAVVVYDDAGGTSAARLWWMLRDAGLRSVFLLDGGLAAWRAAALPLAQDEQSPAPGSVVLGHGHMPAISAEEAAAWPAEGILLDARAGERYRGEVEPVDPRPGHLPGAVSAPTWDNISAQGSFLPAETLRKHFAALGVAPGARVAVYCGSGVTATHQIAALEIAGISAALYPGSYSQWSSNPANLVAVGPEPYGEPDGQDAVGQVRAQSGTGLGAGGSVEA
ncbi:sulfurtransferase [Arthrobacter sp. M4]|uniref:sulfurtransferase n=1 Tax=Arthrobacter sp. M4 TaxID=218160 RepID=UPI001CDB807E|nr:sulfurtransferase [Arthrobacter sp. M4]MCA4132204.1 sulfurtransferase [Arthrobacter sp. M4]